MLRPRIIPILLLRDGGLVKTRQFKDAKYVGDPINAVRIFNEREADELTVLDIDATRMSRRPDFDLIGRLAAECRMPLCYGGGVWKLDDAKRLVELGVEKVSVSSAGLVRPSLVTAMAEELGSQSVVVTLDVAKRRSPVGAAYELRIRNGRERLKGDPVQVATTMQDLGAGEVVLNSVNRDGAMDGYDLRLGRSMREGLRVPVTMLGGAGSWSDIKALLNECGRVGAAAGSLFVFKGAYRAVLINYPSRDQREALADSLSSDGRP